MLPVAKGDDGEGDDGEGDDGRGDDGKEDARRAGAWRPGGNGHPLTPRTDAGRAGVLAQARPAAPPCGTSARRDTGTLGTWPGTIRRTDGPAPV